jgi:hypothetical protein
MARSQLTDLESDELGHFMLLNLGRQNSTMTAIREAIDGGNFKEALRIIRGSTSPLNPMSRSET